MFAATIQINDICNLRCKYCYEGEKTSNYMSDETAHKSLDLIFYNVRKHVDPILDIYFIGGEPLLSFDFIKQIVLNAEDRAEKQQVKMKYNITTNGTYMNKDILEFLILYNFDIKLSLDGTKYSNDMNRIYHNKRGSYESVIANLPYFREYTMKTGKDVQISMVITKNNCEYYMESFKHIVDLGFTDIDSGVNVYEDWKTKDKELLAKQLKGTYKFVADNYIRGNQIRWRYFEKFIDGCSNKSSGYNCMAGALSVYINYDGFIYPCQVSDRIEPIGHVDTGLRYDHIRKEYLQKVMHNDNCNKCSLTDRCCIKYCYAMNLIKNNTIQEPVDIFCYVHRLFFNIIKNSVFYKEIILQDKNSELSS